MKRKVKQQQIEVERKDENRQITEGTLNEGAAQLDARSLKHLRDFLLHFSPHIFFFLFFIF